MSELKAPNKSFERDYNEDAYKLFVDAYECESWPEEYRQRILRTNEYKFLEKAYDFYEQKEIEKAFNKGE